MSGERPAAPFPSYRGEGPFLFVCYAHGDAAEVYPAMSGLRDQGIDVWYDEGISPGRQWRDELADAIGACSLFLFFVSPASVQSSVCRKELNYAVECNKPTLLVHLRDTEMPPGLALATSDVQALLGYRLPPEEFQRKLLAAVRSLVAGTAGAASEPAREPVERTARPATGGRRWPAVGIVVLLAIGLVAAGTWLFLARVEPAPVAPRTIAVLPFDNFTADPANEFISAGLAEEIINLLQKVGSLDVVARTASFYFSGKDLDFATIAQRLQADVILEGSIRRESDRFRIAAQLIDGRTGLHRWSEIFEERTVDLMTLQSNIALRVAQALEAELSPAEIAGIKRPPTTDREAFALYLEARNYLRIAATRADLDNARNLFRQAIARDGAFVEARSGLCEAELAVYQRSLTTRDFSRATSVCARLVTGGEGPPEVLVALGTLNRLAGHYDDALALFDRAIARSADRENAHYGRAMALQGLGRLDEADAELRRCIDLEPGFWQVYSGYGVFLATTGRLEEAVNQFRKVVDLTPDNPQGYGNLGTALFTVGRWEEAEAAWRASLALENTEIGFENLGTLLYQQGQFEAAAGLLEDGLARYPDNFRLWGKLGAAQAEAGRGTAAEAAFERAIDRARELLEVNPDDAYVMMHLGVYEARIGRADLGLSLCARAIALSDADAEMHFLQATALALAGRSDEAKAAADRARALGYSGRVLASDPVLRRL